MEFLDFWQHFYERTERVAFCAGGICVHYYALCYIAALLLALWLGKRYARALGITAAECDAFFIYVEIGIILGARLGYVLVYSPARWWYLAHPWQIFNPFDAAGNFVGIAGMSYHGACVGAAVAAALFARRYKRGTRKASALLWLDLVALSAPFAYTLGRVGNFLNHELFGRVTEAPWGVYVLEQLRHPSQLYEAVLEGICVGFAMHFYLRARQKAAAGGGAFEGGKKAEIDNHFQLNSGEFIALYAALYSLARFVCEFWREPDAQLGELALGLSMGQWLSLLLACCAALLWGKIRRKNA